MTSTRAVPAGRFLLACKVHLANNTVSSMVDSTGANTWGLIGEVNAGVSIAMYGLFTQSSIASGTTFTMAHGVAAANGMLVMEYAGVSASGTWIAWNIGTTAAAATISSAVICLGGGFPQAAYAGKAAALVACAGVNNTSVMTAQAGWVNSFNAALTGGRYNLQELVPKASLVNTEVAQANGTSGIMSVMGVALVAGPEMMHDHSLPGYYRRRSGLVAPRPGVYRSRR